MIMEPNDNQETNFLSNVKAVDQDKFESDLITQIDKAYNDSITEEKATLKSNLSECVEKIKKTNEALKSLNDAHSKHIVSSRSSYADFEKIKNLLNNQIGLKKLELSRLERNERNIRERLKTIKISAKVSDVLDETGRMTMSLSGTSSTSTKKASNSVDITSKPSKSLNHFSTTSESNLKRSKSTVSIKNNKNNQIDNFLFSHLKQNDDKPEKRKKQFNNGTDNNLPIKKSKSEVILLDSPERKKKSNKRKSKDVIVLDSDQESNCSGASDRTMIYEAEEEETGVYSSSLKRKINLDEVDLPNDDEDDGGVSSSVKAKRPKVEYALRDDCQLDYYYERIKELGPEADEELEKISVDSGYSMPQDLWDRLFEYQREGVRWLLQLHLRGSGGILGDEMGLGKTIQVLSFLSGLYASRHQIFELGPCVVVCPATVLRQWLDECRIWAPRFRVVVMHGSAASNSVNTAGSSRNSKVFSNEDKRQKNLLRQLANQVAGIKGHEIPIIVLMTYNAVTNQNEALEKLFNSSGYTGGGYLILDEGHKIKNPDSQTTRLVKKLSSLHRLVLSGSPLQNCLRELWSLTDFVRPGLLGALSDFQTNLALPISRGGYQNATPIQVETAYRCACVLRDALAGTLLRRSKAQVRLQLPKKSEQVLFCGLTPHQITVYREYLSSKECSAILSRQTMPFAGLTMLRKICNHPDLVTGGPRSVLHHPILGFSEEGSFPLEDDDENNSPQDACFKFGHWSRSGKMVVVRELLRSWKPSSNINVNSIAENQQPSPSTSTAAANNVEEISKDHKVLLFCQGRQTLLLLKRMLREEGHTHLCLHGGTSIGTRHALVKRFNTEPASSVFVFLLTTRVGGLGLNLTSADRVILFDPDWNPSTDIQARERAYRIGQRRPVKIYRLVSSGAIEERVYHRQVFKQLLCDRILRNPRQRKFFKTQDLNELFRLDEKGTDSDTTLMLAGSKNHKVINPTLTKVKSRSSLSKSNFFDENPEHKSTIINNLNDDDDDVPCNNLGATTSNNNHDAVEVNSDIEQLDAIEDNKSKSAESTISAREENEEDLEKLRQRAKKISAALERLKQREVQEQKSISVEGKLILNVHNREEYKKDDSKHKQSDHLNGLGTGDSIIDSIVPLSAIKARTDSDHEKHLTVHDRMQIDRVANQALKKLGDASMVSSTSYIKEIVRHDKLIEDELVVKNAHVDPILEKKLSLEKAQAAIRWLKGLIDIGETMIRDGNNIFGENKNRFLWDPKNEEERFLQIVGEKCWKEENKKFHFDSQNKQFNEADSNVRFSSRLLLGLIVNRKQKKIQQQQYLKNGEDDAVIIDANTKNVETIGEPAIGRDIRMLTAELFLFLLQTTIKLNNQLAQLPVSFNKKPVPSQLKHLSIKTNDILTRFKQSVKPDNKIIFRELLSAICEQHKAGKWLLRQEYYVSSEITEKIRKLVNQMKKQKQQG